MNNKYLIPIVLLLTACKTTNPNTGLAVYQPHIPELPTTLGIKAVSLPPITDNSMGGSQIQGAQDDMQYNSIAHQLNKVIDLYNCVRVAINNRKELTECQ